MGETYRGLTIKIGADTSKLSKALQSSNSAIKQTDSELRKLGTALKLDGGNTNAIQKQFAALQQKATQVASKLQTMKTALQQLDESGIGDVANNMQNLSLAAGNAKEKYALADAELAKIYNELEKVAKANDLAFDRDNIDESIAALKEQNLVTDETVAKIDELRAAHQEAFAEGETLKEAQRYRDLAAEIERTEAELNGLANAQLAIKSQNVESVTTAMRQLDAEMSEADDTLGMLQNEFEGLERAAQISPKGLNAVQQAQANINEQTTLLKGKLESLNSAMDALPVDRAKLAATSTTEVAKQAREAEQNYKAAAQEIAELSAKLQEAKAQAAKMEGSADTASDGYKKAKAAVEQLENELTTATAKAKKLESELNTAEAQKEFKELSAQVTNVAVEIGELANKSAALGNSGSVSDSALKSLGMTLYSSVSPAIQQVGEFSIEAGDRIDSAFRNMKKTVQGTDQDFQSLKESALEFSQTNAVSADTILNIEAMGGQLGIAVENLEDFANVASNLDIATDIDADTIAQSLGQLNGILPDLNDNYSSFGDALVRLGNNMPAQESAIMDVTSRIGSMGGIVGMTTPEILAWATAIASTGQNSESAGTAISNTMSDIESAVAAGGDKLQQFADIAGVSAEEFANTWNEHPTQAMQSFIEGLKQLQDNGESVDGALQELGITGVRQKQALMGLTQTTDTLSDALTMSKDAWDGVSDEWGAAGDAAREAAQKSEGFSGSLQILQNNADALGLEIADALVPYIQILTDLVKTVTDVFAGLPEPIQESIIAIGLLGAAAGALVTAYSSINGVIKSYRESTAGANAITKIFASTETAASVNSKKMAVSSATASAGVQTLGTKTATASTQLQRMSVAAKVTSGALKALKVAAGIGAMIAVTALVEVLATAKENSDNLTKATAGLTSSADALAKMTPNASAAIGSLSEQSGSATNSINDLIEAHGNMAQEIADTVSSTADQVNLVQHYADVLGELGGKSGLTQDQVADLKVAVEGFNEACGTNYEVVQNSSGSYQIMADNAAVAADEIANVARNVQLAAQAQAIASSLESMYAQDAEDAAALAEQTKRVADAKAQYVEAQKKASEGDIVAQQSLDGLLDNYEQEKQKLNELKSVTDSQTDAEAKLEDQQRMIQQAMEEGASANLTFAATNATLRAALAEASGSSLDFISACDNMGISLENIDPDVLSELAVSWDGDISQMIAKADELGIEVPESFRSAATQSQQAGTDVATSLANGLSSGSVSVDAATKVLQAYASGDYSAVMQAANDAGISIPEALSSGISMGAYSPSAATSRMMSLVALKLSGGDVEAAAQMLGGDIDAGLAEGIRNGTLSESEAETLGQETIDKAKEALDSHSPSQEFAQIGSDVDAGLAEGISGNTSSPLGAIGSMISQLIGAATGASSGMGTAGSTASTAFASGVGSATSTVLGTASQLKANAEAGVSGTSGTLSSEGSEASNEFANKLISYRNTALQNAMAMRSAATTGVSGAGTETGKQGKTASASFASGVGNSSALSSTRNAANALKAAAANMASGDYRQSGSHLVSNFASGIRSGISWVSSAAESVARAAKAALGFSVPKEGVWSGAEKGGERSGMHLAQNWAAGLSAGQRCVKAASEQLMQDAKSELEGTVAPTINVKAVVDDLSVANGVDLPIAAEETVAYVNDLANELAARSATAQSQAGTQTVQQGGNTQVINQNFQTKVVRSDADMYTAATILNRSALRVAGA